MTRTGCRISLAGLCVLFVLTVGIYTVCTWNDEDILRDRPFNQLVSEAIQLKIDQSRSAFQLGLLIAGALWALIIAKKDEARILLSDRAELTMFVCGNLLLLGSFICHLVYLERIGYVYSLAGGVTVTTGTVTIPDVFSNTMSNPYRLQFWYLIASVVATALTIFSAHVIKRR